jgi:NADPH:quinone reductase-like Zn-dependent oxidoreductase
VKAVVNSKYGSPDDLKLVEIDKPALADDGVLVRVRAASVNPYDWHFMRGLPYLARPMLGLRKPKKSVPGADLAGQVEAVGKDVTQFRPGDEVFGAGWSGSLAEYACGGENDFAPKPAELTFEQAAAIPMAGCTALQSLRDWGQLQPGQKVLINGAAGGVGTFAVQIAKALGGEVTGVCSTKNIDFVRSLGADHVVDYTREDFARSGRLYDLIIDLVSNRSLPDLRRALAPEGALVLCGGGGGRLLGPVPLILRALVRSRFVSQRMLTSTARIHKEDLVALTELIEAGKVTLVIDRTFSLSEAPEAIRYLETGHARGKVVVTV